MEKKRFGAFLKHFSLAQNTLKSYHKLPKSRFNLQGTVQVSSGQAKRKLLTYAKLIVSYSPLVFEMPPRSWSGINEYLSTTIVY